MENIGEGGGAAGGEAAGGEAVGGEAAGGEAAGEVGTAIGQQGGDPSRKSVGKKSAKKVNQKFNLARRRSHYKNYCK